MKKHILILIFLVLALLTLLAFDSYRFFDGKLHLVFCDVGQGDAAFIRTSTQIDILIDGGPDEKVNTCLEKHLPFWDRTIDYVFLTHPDADHLTGLITVARNYRIKEFLTQDKTENNSAVHLELLNVLNSKKVPILALVAGQNIAFKEGTVIKTLWPANDDQRFIVKSKPNTGALINLISYKSFDVLMTADTESEILDHLGMFTGVDVLKVPHHGSKYGMDEKSFNALRPLYSVVSVGKNNYGHPDSNILSLLKKNGVKVLRTDQSGNIEFVTDGKSLSVFTSR